MTATAAREGSVILLVNSQGKIAWQLRDNRPDVSYANHWGLFGGWREMDESPEQTIIREINEELAFSLDLSKLQYIRRHCDGDIVSHVFLYPITDEMDAAQLLEGQRLEFVAPGDLMHRRVVPRHRAIVEWHVRQKTPSA